MQNTLIVWTNKANGEGAEEAIRDGLKRSYGIDAEDLELDTDGQTVDGLEFLFDDETGGIARVDFIKDDPKLFGIKVSALYPWECMEVYGLVEGVVNGDSEV